jgi:hypothetical protein
MESFFSITLLTVCPLPEQIKNEIQTMHLIILLSNEKTVQRSVQ